MFLPSMTDSTLTIALNNILEPHGKIFEGITQTELLYMSFN